MLADQLQAFENLRIVLNNLAFSEADRALVARRNAMRLDFVAEEDGALIDVRLWLFIRMLIGYILHRKKGGQDERQVVYAENRRT